MAKIDEEKRCRICGQPVFLSLIPESLAGLSHPGGQYRRRSPVTTHGNARNAVTKSLSTGRLRSECRAE
jgi:hypothetical protein